MPPDFDTDNVGAFEAEYNGMTETDFENEKKKAEQRTRERYANDMYLDGTPFDLNKDEFIRKHKD